MAARAEKWWGWGFDDRSIPLESRPGLHAYLRRVLELPEGDVLPVPDSTKLAVAGTRLSELDLAMFRETASEERVTTADLDRLTHSVGKSYRDLLRLRLGQLPPPPDLVIYPETDDEIRAILDRCAERRIGVVPFGGGTSVVGGVEIADVARVHVVLDLRRMDRVLSVDPMSLLVTVQAGIRGPSLEEGLNAHRLTAGHFPQSFEFSTLGGWIASRAAGALSNRYGKIEDIVAGLRLITPTGAYEFRGRPRHAMGSDLLSLAVGSEGTLGVISHATIRVHRVPEVRAFDSFLFRSFGEGLEALRRLAQDGIAPHMAYLFDEDETRLVFAAAGGPTGQGLFRDFGIRHLERRGFSFERGSLLFVAYEGAHDVVRDLQNLGRGYCKVAASVGAAPAKQWTTDRFESPYLRDSLIDHRIMVDTVETATVWSNLERLHKASREAILNAISAAGVPGIVGCHVSHVYSEGASLYFTWMAPQKRNEELAQYDAVKAAAIRGFLANGGLLSHHHGIGLDHARFLQEAIGRDAYRLMRDLKRIVDPVGIMNPGKLFPVSG